MLAVPQFLVLDSSTLATVSQHYWSNDSMLREKARTFVARLRDRGIYITFSLTHVIELFRLKDARIVDDRFRLLAALPLIAWLRPYNRSWFITGLPDLLLREINAVVRDSARNWRDVIQQVRPDIWETGTGAEMFVDNNHLWDFVKKASELIHEDEKYIASVARTDPAGISQVKFRDMRNPPSGPDPRQDQQLKRFAAKMKHQLQNHGDARLSQLGQIASDWTADRKQEIAEIYEAGTDPILAILESRNVPLNVVAENTTVAEIGELAVFAEHLALLGPKLNPPIKLTLKDILPGAIPSYTLERKLSAAQNKADRVTGSNIGDGHIAALAWYADAVQVDKRTLEYLKQIARHDPNVANILPVFFREHDYGRIPERFDQCNAA